MVRQFINKIVFGIFTLAGLHLLNKGLLLVEIPQFLLDIENIFFATSGILLILGGLKFLFKRKRNH